MENEEGAPPPQSAPADTVAREKFNRVVSAKRGLEQQVAELKEQNQALEERASTVDALAQQLETAMGKVSEAEDRFTRYQAISSAVESTDSEVIEAFEWQYGRLTGDEKPALGEWIAGLKEKPDTAPAVLRPWLAKQEEKQPAQRRASPSAGHTQPPGGSSAFSSEQMRAAKQELLQGNPAKWLAMRKQMGIE